MQSLTVLVLAVLLACAAAFKAGARGASALRMSSDVDRLVGKVAQSKLLTKVRVLAQSCLLALPNVSLPHSSHLLSSPHPHATTDRRPSWGC